MEVSSHGQLNYTGNVDTRAPQRHSRHAAARSGGLLHRQQPANGASTADLNPTAAAIIRRTISHSLASSNVVIATDNARQSGSKRRHLRQRERSAGAPTTRSRSAPIATSTFDQSASPMVTNTGAGNLVLRADNTGTGLGTVVFDRTGGHGHVDFSSSTGTVSIFYNPIRRRSDSQIPESDGFLLSSLPRRGRFRQPDPAVATDGLHAGQQRQRSADAVRTNQSGTYALGRDINAGSIANFAPIPNFTGLFDGQGQIHRQPDDRVRQPRTLGCSAPSAAPAWSATST